LLKLITACHTKLADKLNKTCQSPSDQGIDLLFKNSLADIRTADIELSAKQTGVSIPWSEPAEVSVARGARSSVENSLVNKEQYARPCA